MTSVALEQRRALARYDLRQLPVRSGTIARHAAPNEALADGAADVTEK
jgi:hypothetical protein